MLWTQLEVLTWEKMLDARGRTAPRQLRPVGDLCQGRNTGEEQQMTSAWTGTHLRG